jgi:hypothetical protein
LCLSTCIKTDNLIKNPESALTTGQYDRQLIINHNLQIDETAHLLLLQHNLQELVQFLDEVGLELEGLEEALHGLQFGGRVFELGIQLRVDFGTGGLEAV